MCGSLAMSLRLRLALPLTISLLFVGGSFLAPSIATAQTQQDCESNAPPQVCFSYDPTVNPLLKSAGASYRDPAQTTPKTDPDRGECVTYNVATGVGTGCMKGGVFTVYSPNPGVEGISFITIQTGGPADVYNPDPVAKAIEGTVSAFVNCTFNGPVDCLITGLGNSILALSNLLLGMAGIFLNLVIVKTVFGFSTFIGNSPGLLVAWGILRDLGNMLLLFGFIFIGIATILDLQTYSAKKALPRLLIFAVLMNFSLFAAEAIIDVSNVMSAALYAQGNSDPCFGQSGETIEVAASTDPEADREACLLNVGLAGAMMEASGLSTMFQIKDDQGITDIVTFIGLSLFAVIGAVVFFAAGIMLLTRALVLTFLMITAPIGFAAMALPPMQKFGEEWWNKLIHQAFFAPILILLILVSLKVSESFAGGKENGLAGALTQPNSSAMGVILVFAIVIGLLISSLMAAKKFGAMGADFAINSSKRFVNAPFSFAGRNTIGRGGAWAQKGYETWMGKDKSNQSRAGKAARFLLRNNVMGLDSAIDGATGKAKNARFGGSKSFEESKKRKEERDKTFKSAREKAEAEERKAQNQRDLDEALEEKKVAEAAGDDTKQREAEDKVAQILERMSAKELEELDALKKAGANLDVLAKNLSPEKFAALVKDGGALTENQRKQARDARFRELGNEVQRQKDVLADPNSTQAQRDAAKGAIASRLKSYSSKDIENMSPDLLSDQAVLDNLTSGQREDLIKSNKVSPGIARELKRRDPVEQIKSEFAANAGNAQAQAAVVNRIAGLKPKQVAKLSDEILTNMQVMGILNPAMLNAINDAGDISPAARATIGSRLKLRKLTDASIANYLDNTPGGALWV